MTTNQHPLTNGLTCQVVRAGKTLSRRGEDLVVASCALWAVESQTQTAPLPVFLI
jgi:hypothetical protein